MTAITYQHGDPEYIRLFSQQLEEDAKTKAAIDARRRAFTESELAAGFNSPGGGRAAQAVEANYMSPNGVRLETTVRTNSENTWGAANLYESSDWDNERVVNTVTSGGAGGPIGTALAPPTASA